MSRIGKLPIPVPAGVTVTVDEDNLVTVKGPKGTLSQKVNKDIKVSQENGEIIVTRPSDSKPHKSMHGLYRALIHNMVVGVTKGFEKVLVMEGRRLPRAGRRQAAHPERWLLPPRHLRRAGNHLL